MWFSNPVMSVSNLLTNFFTRGCISAVTVAVNKWMAPFSPQPKQAPSPLARDW
jgi:hypothetical protein